MSKRILVIEDNEQNLYLVTFLLTCHGYEILQARDGAAGIEMATQEKPDLILLDIQLPVMDGYAVAKVLKNQPETKAIPIVAVTSHAMSGDRETILKTGCEGYIEKPIDPDNFVEQIRRFL